MKPLQEIELTGQNRLRDRYKELPERKHITEDEVYEFNLVEIELVKRPLNGAVRRF